MVATTLLNVAILWRNGGKVVCYLECRIVSDRNYVQQACIILYVMA